MPNIMNKPNLSELRKSIKHRVIDLELDQIKSGPGRRGWQHVILAKLRERGIVISKQTLSNAFCNRHSAGVEELLNQVWSILDAWPAQPDKACINTPCTEKQ